jgi:DNA-binding NarL/FixJ family response regulator
LNANWNELAMLKKLTTKQGDRQAAEAARKLLSLEVNEISEIAERLFVKLDSRMKTLSALEERLDKKITSLEALLLKAENAKHASRRVDDNRYHEIAELVDKGLKVDEIAGVLDMPRGEIELILSLRK